MFSGVLVGLFFTGFPLSCWIRDWSRVCPPFLIFAGFFAASLLFEWDGLLRNGEGERDGECFRDGEGDEEGDGEVDRLAEH